MALDFPSSPTNGQVYGTYTYDSVVGVWRTTPDLASGLPAGTIVQWPGATAPANWMIADGAAVSRTTYASLFAAIGVQYGSGDGSTTFNLPNLKGRVAVGLDSSQTEFDTLGETGGAKTHTLTASQIPSHTHTISSDGAHTHTTQIQIWQSNNEAGGFGLNSSTSFQNRPAVFSTSTAGQWGSSSAGAHSHGGATGSAGSDGAHNNLQPYIVLNYIIKTSAGITSGDSELATRVGAAETKLNTTPLSPNYVINGALDFWQRSTSAAQAGNSGGWPSADRFRVGTVGASSPAITLARSTDVPAGIGVQYSAAMSWSSNISGGDVFIHQGIENGKYLFAGKTMTVSFYAKAATAIQSKFDFDQDYGETLFNLTTSWLRYSYTITLPSNYATSRPGIAAQNDNVELRFIRFTSISSASNTIYFTGLQVEEGSVATAFKRSAPSLQAELAACQRYFQAIGMGGNSAKIGWGNIYNGTTGIVTVTTKQTMRAAPTFSYSGSLANYSLHVPGIVISNVTALSMDNSSVDAATLAVTAGSGFTAGHACVFQSNTVGAGVWLSADI